MPHDHPSSKEQFAWAEQSRVNAGDFTVEWDGGKSSFGMVDEKEAKFLAAHMNEAFRSGCAHAEQMRRALERIIERSNDPVAHSIAGEALIPVPASEPCAACAEKDALLAEAQAFVEQAEQAGCDRCERHRDETGHYPYCPVGEGTQAGVCSCNERPAQPPPAVDEAHLYASNLLESLVEKYGRPPGWQPLPDLLGKLTQIDNVIAGLLRRAAQPPLPQRYRVQAFWSPDQKHLVTVHATPSDIMLIDDNGNIWKAAGPEKDIADVEDAAIKRSDVSAPSPPLPDDPNEGPIVHGYVQVIDGVLPAFHNHWSCIQCGRRAEYVRENGCPEKCGRTPKTKFPSTEGQS
jgi:hypothetical protein